LIVEVHGVTGRTASGVFPLVWNPFNGIYELQLSQGCLIGSPGGCAVTAPDAMRQLFAALPQAEDSWHPDVRMTLTLVQLDGKAHPENPRFHFQWKTGSTEPQKTVNYPSAAETVSALAHTLHQSLHPPVADDDLCH
jgi:hypothetical protein